MIEERSYSGKLFRPAPEVLLEDQSGLLIVATPWGPRAAAKRFNESVRDYVLSAQQDAEVTSPFQPISGLSKMGNTLRVAVMLANDQVYRDENKNEHLAGIEAAILIRSEQELVYVQIGQPQILLDRFDEFLVPLSVACDFSTAYTRLARRALTPLPSNLLGTSATSNFCVQSIRPLQGDQIVLLSRSLMPPSLLSCPRKLRSVDEMTKTLAQDDPEMPFWISKLEFSTPAMS